MQQSTENSQIHYSSTKDKLPKILLLIIVSVIILIIIVLGMLVKSVFFTKPIPRSALEREYLYWKTVCSEKEVDSRSLRELARAEFDMGMKDDAIKHMQQAIKIAPDARSLHYYLGKMLWSTGKIDKALQEYEKELELAPHAPSCYDMGQIYITMGETEKAIECLEKVVERMPEDADAHISLGNLYEEIGKEDLAKSEYLKALNYIPDYSRAIEALKKLEEKNSSEK